MRPFDHLTHQGQQRRLRALALAALAHYDLPPFSLRALLHRENTTFRVDLDSGERLVLRISKPGAGLAVVRSEALWLQSLRQRLTVPEPVPGRDGRLVSQFDIESIPDPRACCLFKWVEGRFRQVQHLGPDAIARLGRFMGEMHLHAGAFTPPPGFTRPKLDLAGILGGAHGGRLDDLKAVAPRPSVALIADAVDQVADAMERVGVGRETFGLIHADFHAGNYLFHRGEVHAIDFDACSCGYYLSDIAAAARMLDHPRYDEATVLRHFLRGYRTVRPLTPDHERQIGVFKAANNLMLALWMTSRRDSPLLRSYAADFIAKQLGQLQAHLKSA